MVMQVAFNSGLPTAAGGSRNYEVLGQLFTVHVIGWQGCSVIDQTGTVISGLQRTWLLATFSREKWDENHLNF